MPDSHYDLSGILGAYPADCGPRRAAEQASIDGFSGSRIWRLHTERGMLCLRRWPREYSDLIHLRWVHGILAGVFQAGFYLLPIPIKIATGETFVRHDGYLWQLEPWLPGEADHELPPFQPASATRVEAALTALGQFHHAVAIDSANRLPDGPAPGLLKRLAELKALQSGGLDRLTADISVNRHVWPELAERAPPLLKAFRLAAPHIAEALQKAKPWNVPIRPCIRDIHRQHVLFEANRVTGIVDFGAMQPDHVASDIARLLGSLAGDEPALWQIGLEAYQRCQGLAESEQLLVQIYNESGMLLSGIHWLQWVFVDGRQFENRQAVLARFDEILSRLVRLTARTSSPAGAIV
jgi:Ser/Thr protein kinase RdoA (MazF antagonist)